MGGLDDTTNCFQPILSIITNVDLDHTAFLGPSIQAIALHKAGIIKQNIPVVIGETKGEALSIIHQTANELHAPIYRVNNDFSYKNIKQLNHKQVYDWSCDSETFLRVAIAMQGEHQVKNSSFALMAIHVMKNLNIKIDWNKALAGLSSTTFPGRFELIQTNPTIILDGAHNPAGVHAFIETLTKNNTNVERHLLFAAFKDKDIYEMLKLLLPYFKTVTLSSFDHPRAASNEQLYEIAKLETNVNVSDWQEVIKQMNNNSDQTYYITGSLHFIGVVRSFVTMDEINKK